MNTKKLTKRDVEKTLSDLLRELRRTSPWMLEAIIEDRMEQTGCSEDEAIRWLAEFETLTERLLKASQSIGEA